jgi:hypothetical protein
VIFPSIGWLLLQAAVPQSAQAPPGVLPVQMGYSVSPDTVLIAQPFDFFIKVLAPRGVRFEFPVSPDTTTRNSVRPIELRGEKLVTMLGDTAVALYHLVAWDVGVQPLMFPDVRVTFGDQERLIPLGGAFVFVKSVLPTDKDLRIPKPARPLIVLPEVHWLGWLALLAVLIAAALLWWAWRRYRNRPKAPVDPYAHALEEFARIEQQRLLEDGRYADYYAAMIDVTREYLAARVPGVRRSNTSSELLRTMQPRDGVEAELPRLLARADLVKFARADVSLEEAREAGTALRAMVDHVEARLNPESEPGKRATALAAAAAAAKERAA